MDVLMDSRKLEGAIFDLDGVITDTSRLHYKAWSKLATEIGISLTEEFNKKLKGVSRMDSLNLILSLNESKFTEKERIDLANKKNKYYLDLIINLKPKDLIPGTINCLNNLRKKGVKICLASASRNAMKIIRKLDIEKFFDCVVNANEITKSKPDSEIFLNALSMLKLSPNNCIGIEDSLAGIIAINKCGMFSIGIGNNNELYMANICFKSLEEFDLEMVKVIGGYL